MEKFDLYRDIATRTNGDIYLGVVGPVRAGKSTFIARFMEELVLPNISARHVKERAIDEMPQSADGKAIMTTQPKFVPAEAVAVKLKDNLEFKVRMVDCVGYVVDGATGHKDGSKPRLVKTPWSDQEMPFEEAAEIGTKKVITDHSTIGIVVTSDGSIGTELTRAGYQKAEERVIHEMKATGKPFVVVLNSANADSDACKKTAASMCDKYDVSVMPMDVKNMSLDTINALLEQVLLEFPLRFVDFRMPKWMQTMDREHHLMHKLTEHACALAAKMNKMRDYTLGAESFSDCDELEPLKLGSIALGQGRVIYEFAPKPELFWTVLSDECDTPIDSDYKLMAHIKQLVTAKRAYDKLKDALAEVEETGYGVVTPTLDDMTLEEPEIVRQGGRFGVRLKANAPSLHIMKVDLKTEVSPIVGTEQQSEDLVKYLLEEFETNPQGIWETQMFGKSLHSLVKEGLDTKLHGMPPEAQKKMRRTLSRIVNEGRGGVICILL